MKPIIGINCDVEPTKNNKSMLSQIDKRYLDAVERAGGIPLLITPTQNYADAQRMLEQIDGLILSGGNDLHPKHWGETQVHPKAKLLHEEKETFDLWLAHYGLQKNLPILGICYGMQLLCVAAGGKMCQHIADAFPHASDHENSVHDVALLPNSKLHAILQQSRLRVASSHHQAVTNPGSMKISAKSAEGIIEAVEDADKNFLLGVQWHPERAPQTENLFHSLIQAAQQHAAVS